MTDSTTLARTGSDMPGWQRQRRERIVRAALELLQHGEYDKIQVRDVGERSGFALGTIYRYFNSKEHLYAAVLLEWANSLSGNLRRQPLRTAEGIVDLIFSAPPAAVVAAHEAVAG